MRIVHELLYAHSLCPPSCSYGSLRARAFHRGRNLGVGAVAGHQRGQTSQYHRPQRSPSNAASRYAVWRFIYALAVCLPHKICAGYEGHAALASRRGPNRVGVVWSFYFAVGEQWDESQLKAYPAGTLYSEP